MKNWLRRLLQWKSPELICMRTIDMQVVHPDQITASCAECGEEIGIYPSGQRALRDVPGIKAVCQMCRTPGPRAALAPGAEVEPFQSVKKK